MPKTLTAKEAEKIALEEGASKVNAKFNFVYSSNALAVTIAGGAKEGITEDDLVHMRNYKDKLDKCIAKGRYW